MSDVLILLDYAMQKQRLGDIKCFVKDSLKYVPGVGWGMILLDFPFIKRNWEEDKQGIHKIFSGYKSNNIPFWMISFSEGTRLRPRNLKKSQEYAQKQGMPIPQNVLIPRVKGFLATLEQLGESAEAVYDFTIGYVEGVPSLWQFTTGFVKSVHLQVKRYPLNVLPQSPQERSQWLIEIFRKKDASLANFYIKGAFDP